MVCGCYLTSQLLTATVRKHTHTLTHTFTRQYSRTTFVSWYQKINQHRFFFAAAAIDDGHGSGDNSLRCAKLWSNHHHQYITTQFFTGWMPLQLPNQHCQSTKAFSAKIRHIVHSNQSDPIKSTQEQTHHSFHFNGHFPGEPMLAGFIEAEDDGSSGDNWSYKLSPPLPSSSASTKPANRGSPLK